MKTPSGRLSFIALAASTLLILAGCTNTEEPAPSQSGAKETTLGAGGRDAAEKVQEDASVAALVPGKIAESGVLNLVTDPTYAPMEFTDASGNIVGLEPDLAIAAAKKMGLKAEISRADFNGILAGLESNRYDASWATWSVTQERTAVVDMVSYFNAGTAIMVKPGKEKEITSIDDLCGLTLTAQTGTTQALTVIPSFEQNCKEKSLPQITPLIVPQQDSANQAVASGRANAMIADNSLIAYYAQVQPDKYSTVPGILVQPALIGVAMPKGENTLAPAFQAAIQSLIDDGTYATIIRAWGLSDSALETAKINPEEN